MDRFALILKNKKLFFGLTAFVIAAFIFAVAALLSGNTHGIEKTGQELLSLAQNVREHYKVRPDYWGLSSESAIKNQIVPAQMLHGQKILNALGRPVILGQDPQGNMIMPGTRNFMISMSNLSKSACIELASREFGPDEHLGLLKITIFAPDQVFEFEWGGPFGLPISRDAAAQACKNLNTIGWTFE